MFFSIRNVCLFLVCNNASAFVGRQTATPFIRQQPSSLTELQAVATVTTEKNIESLLRTHRATVDALGAVSRDVSEIRRLRFALAFDTLSEAEGALRASLAYRSTGTGKAIVEAALDAFDTATIGGGWDNEPIRNAAPHAALINEYISSKSIVTMSTSDADLVYVIRASAINDKEMMDHVTVPQLGEFFLYVKEIHNLVADRRSQQNGRLCEVIFANDITGVRAAPDKRFSKALTESSSQYETLFPSLAGPTMILNLPFILQAFIALFKPLFPKTVQARLKFVRAPVLAGLPELTPLTTDPSTKKAFLQEIDDLLLK